MQYCAEPGCPVRVQSGRCLSHRYVKVEIPDVRKLYRLARWLRMRDEVIREQPFCMVCLSEGRRMITQEIDHIVPHEGHVDRFWDRSNLQGLCKGCHSRKTRSGR